MSVQPVVSIDQVSFGYNGETVLDNVDLKITEREFVWIVGPNGGGKTTLLKLMLGLLKPRSGKVQLFGQSALKGRLRLGYMPQAVQLDRQFPVDVLDVALMGRLSRGLIPGPYTADDKRAAIEALETVGLADKQHRRLSELSGGQQRRLLIARALSSEPELLVLDEPTANLDKQIESDLYNLLKRLNERLTIVMVSHDPAFVSDFVEHVVCVNRTVAMHPTADIKAGSLSDVYGSPVRMIRHDLHNHGKKRKQDES